MEEKKDRDLSASSDPQLELGQAKRGVKFKPVAVIGIALLVIVAVVIVLFLRRGTQGLEGRPVPAPSGEAVPSPSTGTSAHAGEIILTLPADEVANAQIKTEAVTEQAGSGPDSVGELRTTGTVSSNAYKETQIFPVAGGIVRQVNAELGDKVKRGQSLATIFSADLANAQGEYLKLIAEHDQHEREHHRTEQLVEIGASSREELEQSKAKIESMLAEIAKARQQMILLGMSRQQIDTLRSPDQVSSIISVTAPVTGSILTRSVNPGEVVASGKEMFRVVDLSSVWVIGQIYEKDFSTVRLGTRAAITSPSFPGRTFSGRVSYLDPRVDPQTRTAQVRIEVSNPGEVLKIGMFVDVSFGEAPVGVAKDKAVLVPKAAIQTIGSKQVVFVATGQPGEFIQRDVTVGSESDGFISVYQGLNAGERVVTDGSFLLRAESLKQKPDQSNSSNANKR